MFSLLDATLTANVQRLQQLVKAPGALLPRFDGNTLPCSSNLSMASNQRFCITMAQVCVLNLQHST